MSYYVESIRTYVSSSSGLSVTSSSVCSTSPSVPVPSLAPVVVSSSRPVYSSCSSRPAPSEGRFVPVCSYSSCSSCPVPSIGRFVPVPVASSVPLPVPFCHLSQFPVPPRPVPSPVPQSSFVAQFACPSVFCFLLLVASVVLPFFAR